MRHICSDVGLPGRNVLMLTSDPRVLILAQVAAVKDSKITTFCHVVQMKERVGQNVLRMGRRDT